MLNSNKAYPILSTFRVYVLRAFSAAIAASSNKPVKVTARRSGWQSLFFSQVSGSAVSNHAGSPLP